MTKAIGLIIGAGAAFIAWMLYRRAPSATSDKKILPAPALDEHAAANLEAELSGLEPEPLTIVIDRSSRDFEQ